MSIVELDEAECRRLLGRASVGRVEVTIGPRFLPCSR